jgi:glycosyltransferase involved in cell wall biosynthesis
MKRVTFLHPHCMLAGGSTTFLLQVCLQLIRQGDWEINVVSIRSDPAIVAEARQAGVRFVDVGGPLSSSIWFWVLYPLMFWRIYRAARALDTPVVVSEPFPANWWGWFYKALRPSVKLIYVCHEPTAFIYSKAWINSIKPNYMRWGLKLANPLFRWVEHRFMPITDLVEVNSRFSAEEVKATFPALAVDKIRLVYGGIDHSIFHTRSSVKRLPQVVMVGVLSKFKNTDLVIRAVHLLHQQKKYQHIRLVIKGKGFEKESLTQLAATLGISGSVEIIDTFYSDDQLANLLCSSRALVHAAHNEPFGLSVIEALACGTPAVVTGTGGTRETVGNGQSGLYFEPGNLADLAQKLASLFDDEMYWQELSDGAVAQARRFTWEQTDSSFRQLLDEAIGAPQSVI